MDNYSPFSFYSIKNIDYSINYFNMQNNTVMTRRTYTQTIRKGRFLITICHNIKKEQRKLDKEQTTVVKIGRFVVTTNYVIIKKEPQHQPEIKKPIVVRKGRFVITQY